MIFDSGIIARRVWLALELAQDPQPSSSEIWYEKGKTLLGIFSFQQKPVLRLNGGGASYRCLLDLISYHNEFVNGDIAVNVIAGDRFQKLVERSNPCCTVRL